MSYCFVIPNYNHTNGFPELVAHLAQQGRPIIIINDASDELTSQTIMGVAKQQPLVQVLTHEFNQGKGGAVQTGLLYAHDQGYSHAIQVDADGQHDLYDIDRLIQVSQQHPDALVSGAPIYDDSIPKLRYFARYITHFWVTIETFSFQLKDTMCGFRVYPLKACHALFNRVSLGKRMDFDIEVMVRLYWQGVDCRFLPTKVIYPEDGISHFNALDDNLRISCMHTRLCLGGLIRLPKLLTRNVKRWFA